MIVLQQKHHRQLPRRGHVQRLVERPLIGRAVAEKGHRDRAVAPDLGGQRAARRQRDACAHDAVGAQNAQLHVHDVHGPAPAPAVARLLAEQLRHGPVRAGSLGKAVPVPPVGGGDVIRLPQRKARANAAGFLSHVEVDVPRQLAAGEALGSLRLKGADQRHPPVCLPVPLHAAARLCRIQ